MKQLNLVEQRKRDQKITELDGIKDYKKHLKEIQQGYPEPRVPRRPADALKSKQSQEQTGDKVKKKAASPDLDSLSNNRIVKREVKGHADPEVVAMNH